MPTHPQRRQRVSSTPYPANFTRRSFLAASLTGIGAATVRSASGWSAEPTQADPQPVSDLPRLDLHVHLDNSTIDKVLELSHERGVKFGIVEHAGTEENKYPVVLSNDEELGGYLAMLDGKPVYRGVQTEWHDWAGCFSPKMLARLDYILTDAMTFPGRDGQRVKLWEKDVESRVDMGRGIVGTVVAFQDISARQSAIDETTRLMQRNTLLLNSAGDGIYGTDLNGHCSFINPAALAILLALTMIVQMIGLPQPVTGPLVNLILMTVIGMGRMISLDFS